MIKVLQFLSLSALFIGLQIAAAKDTTVVLQNSPDGYDGCEDSYVYITYGLGAGNYGDSVVLKVHKES